MSWPLKDFSELAEDMTRGNLKTSQSDFLASGQFPIVDQGKDFIAGYADDETRLCRIKGPVVVFGDHTKVLKYVDFPFCLGADGTKILRAKEGVDPKYLFYGLQQVHIPEAGYSRHFKDLKEGRIPLPPLPEQRRISAILDQADALRRLRRQSLTRLADFGAATLAGAKVASGQAKVTLASLFSDVRIGPFGSLLHKSDYVLDGIPLVNPMHIFEGRIVPGGGYSVTVEKAATLGRYRIKAGDIVMGRRGEMGRAALVEASHEGYLCGTGSMVLAVNPSKADAQFMVDYLRSPLIAAKLERVAGGVTMANLNTNSLEKVDVEVPTLAEQQRYVSAKESVGRCRALWTQDLDKVDNFFASLQHRAFNGEL